MNTPLLTYTPPALRPGYHYEPGTCTCSAAHPYERPYSPTPTTERISLREFKRLFRRARPRRSRIFSFAVTSRLCTGELRTVCGFVSGDVTKRIAKTRARRWVADGKPLDQIIGVNVFEIPHLTIVQVASTITGGVR